MTSASSLLALDLVNEPIGGGSVTDLAIEASAGTGKTYALTALFARLIAENQSITVERLLVVTFTRNAAASLRARIREQLTAVLKELIDPSTDPTPFPHQLRRQLGSESNNARQRIEVAIASLDSANVMTIDSFCSQILRLGGLVVQPDGASQQLTAKIRRAVNDEALLSPSSTFVMNECIDERRYQEFVTEQLRRPMAEPRFMDGDPDSDVLARLNRLCQVVQSASSDSISFDEVKRRAVDLLNAGGAVRDALARQYRAVLIDEAQDTDWMQWRLFNLLWHAMRLDAQQTGEGTTRVFVGDPKQSIYGFRGADVAAYAHQVNITRQSGLSRVLNTNYRSDKKLIDALNVLLDGSSYGPSAAYEEVVAGSTGKQLVGRGNAVIPLSLIQCDTLLTKTKKGKLSYSASLVIKPAAARVIELLSNSVGVSDKDGTTTLLKSDIAILTASGDNARAIQRQLHKWNVPAVSNSTSSVADSDAFIAWTWLARALARPSDEGRVRRCLMSTLFGMSGLDARLQSSDFIGERQELFERWRLTLVNAGVVALALEILSEESVNQSFLWGPNFLRRLTDFNHVVELVSDTVRGRGVSPNALAEALVEIAKRDKMDETAARRVESDDDAVQVMTVHAAKGLEFPVVIVADTWKVGTRSTGPSVVAVDPTDVPQPNDPQTRQWLDASWVQPSTDSDKVFQRVEEDELNDKKRLFYVAVTRAKHSLSILTTSPMGDSETKSSLPIHCLNMADEELDKLEKDGALLRVNGKQLVSDVRAFPAVDRLTQILTVAPSNRTLGQTRDRVSYSSLIDKLAGGRDSQRHSVFEELIRQQDEIGNVSVDSGFVSEAHMPLWELPAGGHVGDVFHKIFEYLDVYADNFEAELARVVTRHASLDFMTPHHERLIEGLMQICMTPLGAELGNITLRDIDPKYRVAEMRFETAVSVGMPGDAASVGDIGEYLLARLGPDDPLRGYGEDLKSQGANELIRGMLNGSIDKIIPVGSGESIRFYISDYKSNKVATPLDTRPMDRYTPENLQQVMDNAHYPLQALLYGVSLYRYLRWRAPSMDADTAVAGWSYLFLRGMLGEAATETQGGVHGVSTWSSRQYPRFWSGLSDVLMGRKV